MTVSNLKNIFFIFLLMIVVAACNTHKGSEERIPVEIVENPRSASKEGQTKKIPAIFFENTEHDFGKVIQGEKVSYHFKFKNIGKADLVISEVSTSCGCTAPEYTSKPVKPGDDGSIKVTFDSNKRRGYQNKTITVVSNTNPNVKILRIKAQVIVPEKL